MLVCAGNGPGHCVCICVGGRGSGGGTLFFLGSTSDLSETSASHVVVCAINRPKYADEQIRRRPEGRQCKCDVAVDHLEPSNDAGAVTKVL